MPFYKEFKLLNSDCIKWSDSSFVELEDLFPVLVRLKYYIILYYSHTNINDDYLKLIFIYNPMTNLKNKNITINSENICSKEVVRITSKTFKDTSFSIKVLNPTG